MLPHKELKTRALARPEVKAEYKALEDEFVLLDEFLRARARAGLTQAEIAKRIGTTQSAIARLESGSGKRTPSLAKLRKYACAVGCRLELRLVKERAKRKLQGVATSAKGQPRKRASR